MEPLKRPHRGGVSRGAECNVGRRRQVETSHLLREQCYRYQGQERNGLVVIEAAVGVIQEFLLLLVLLLIVTTRIVIQFANRQLMDRLSDQSHTEQIGLPLTGTDSRVTTPNYTDTEPSDQQQLLPEMAEGSQGSGLSSFPGLSSVGVRAGVTPMYIPMMPPPGALGTPFFEGANVTEFLERYEDQCEDARLTERERVRRLPRYCTLPVGQYVKAMDGWSSGNWDQLKDAMLSEYRDTDTFQQLNSRRYLETLKSKKRTSADDVRQYIRQYTAVSRVLMERKLLEEYTRGTWFLNGLPDEMRAKVIRRCNVHRDRPETVKFASLSRTALDLCTADRTVRDFAESDVMEAEGLSELVDQFEPGKVKVEGTQKFAAPVAAAPTVTSTGIGKEVDELTEAMKGWTLAARAMAQSAGGPYRGQAFDGPGLRNRGGTYTASQRPARVPPLSQKGEAEAGVSNNKGVVSNARADVQQAGPPGPGRSQCRYCLEEGHYRQGCPELRADVERGLCHEGPDRLLRLGAWGAQSKPAFFYPGRSQMEQVRQQHNQLTTNVNTIMLREYSQGTDDEDELDGQAEVLAAITERRHRGGEEKWKNPSRVLKKKVEKERKLAVPKVQKVGEWKPATVEDLEGEEEVVREMDIDPTTISKMIKERVARPKQVKFADVLRAESDPMALLNRLLDQPARDVTIRDVIGCSDVLQRLMFKNIPSDVKERAGIVTGAATETGVRVNSIEAEQGFYAATSPRLLVTIGDGKRVHGLLDTGAEINVMTLALADAAGLAIRAGPKLVLVAHTGNTRGFVGVCENVVIQVGGVETVQQVFVVDEADHVLVLGQPYFLSTSLSLTYKDGCQYATLVDGSRMKEVTVRVHNGKEKKTETDLFPGNE